MNMAELEGLAERVYEYLGLDHGEPTSTVEMARRLLGRDAVRVVPGPRLSFSRAALIPFDEKWRIFIRSDLAPGEVGHTVGHELAHWVFRKIGAELPNEEDSANRLGAMFVAPRKALRRAVYYCGHDPKKLANAFSTTQSSIFLRYGEANNVPLALARPGHVYTRGGWSPAPRILNQWLTHGGPGITKVAITDAPKRAGIIAA